MAVNLGINDFLANFQGGARPNLFAVVLNFPQNIGLALNTVGQTLTYMCKAASIPSSTLGKAEVAYMGRKIKVVGDKEFDDWEVTIINDIDYNLRGLFEQWHDAMNGNITNRASTLAVNPSNYYGTGDVYQLNKDGNTLAHYKMEGIWPLSIGQIELNYETVDTVEEFPVSFAVNQWQRVGLTDLDEINSSLSTLITNTKIAF